MRLKISISPLFLLVLLQSTSIYCNELINQTANSRFGKNIWVKNEKQEECIKKNCDYDNLYLANGNKIKREINIALLIPEKPVVADKNIVLKGILPVVELAVDEAKRRILPNYEIKVHPRNTQCSSTYGPLAALELYSKKQVDVFLGPICDYVLAPIARYCSVWNISIITTGGQSAGFQFKSTQFPTLTRLMGSFSEGGNGVKNILKHFNWTKSAYLYHQFHVSQELGNSDCSRTLSAISNIVNGTLAHRHFDEQEVNYNQIKSILEDFKSKTRILMMCANATTIRRIMLAAEELKMIDSGEYVFFNIEIFGSKASKTPWYVEHDTPERNRRARKAYSALLTVTVWQPENKEYQNFSDEVKELASTKYNYTFDKNEQISTFVMAFYDAVLLFSYALNNTITELGEDLVFNSPFNSTKIATNMWGKTFQGITGNVTIDSNGDRYSEYSLLDMNENTGIFEIVAKYNHETGLQFLEGKKIYWPGGLLHPPLDEPICGFDGSLCPDDSMGYFQMLTYFLLFIVVILVIVSLIGYRHYKQEAEINLMTWKINPNDICPCPGPNNIRNSIQSMTGSINSQISDLGSIAGDRQMYIPIGFYKGNRVAIKKIDMTGINLNRALMLELKTMKTLQNDHLVRFYGAAIDGEANCILTEYCPKGSLEDILENEEIKLDWMFKLSLMHDIVKGMCYLHNSDLKSHGSLKSSNCVVDSRFVLKITDFGLYQLRRNSPDEYDSHAFWKKFLWTAPEILRMENSKPEGTPKGDIYSFAIIVNEIVSRAGVFYLGDDVTKSPKEIVQLVSKTSNGVPFRPKVDETSYADVNDIMIKCWAEDPSARPTFEQLKQIIRKINKENESGNIVDNILQRLEQYSANLEFLVEERTQDYMEEKRKCEELLYQLLPKSVAAQLIMGRSVNAEIYESVTIYFSDIVGFTSISAESTPMQVVDLLNDLYTCFDSIVENFDVYKVETIGDAYMVVSGCPMRNGNLHAKEIARMSLALLNQVHKFTIKHRPNEQLMLRIGLHSGSCCAGVVGLKMPRYCLFGDTVNTASRMESNGEALKIHMSHSTKQILDTFGNFDIAERGLVAMKGKGQMLTYWLNGEHPNEDLKTFEDKSLENGNLNEQNLVKNINNNNNNNPTNLPNKINNLNNKKLLKNASMKGSFIGNKSSNNDIKNNQNNIKNSQNPKKQLSFGKKKVTLNNDCIQPLIKKL